MRFLILVEHPTKPSSTLTNSIKSVYTNATSLNASKRAELLARFPQVDAIFVTETWFQPNFHTHIDHFREFRKDRDGTGGGVVIYVRDSFMSSEVSDPSLRNILNLQNSQVEQVWCEISPTTNSKKILLGCIYRPPSTCMSSNFQMASAINRAIASILRFRVLILR